MVHSEIEYKIAKGHLSTINGDGWTTGQQPRPVDDTHTPTRTLSLTTLATTHTTTGNPPDSPSIEHTENYRIYKTTKYRRKSPVTGQAQPLLGTASGPQSDIPTAITAVEMYIYRRRGHAIFNDRRDYSTAVRARTRTRRVPGSNHVTNTLCER